MLQNNLLYFALSHLRATPYKVLYNLKIFTSAFFSIILLGQKIGRQRWTALIGLFAGMAIVQTGRQELERQNFQSPYYGFEQSLGSLAVLGAAITSGFSGVYQQRILQGSNTSMWIRNLQMGITSVLTGILSVLMKDRREVTSNGFFSGYSTLVWMVIGLQAIGGLNVAFILKYADTIMKGFAAAFSTLAACVVEMLFFGFRPSITFILGSVLINASAYFYNRNSPLGGKAVSKRMSTGHTNLYRI